MKWVRRIRRRWLRRHGDPNQRGLREFVYLDDTTVYSLLASHGPVVTTITATESMTTATEGTDKIGLAVGPAKAESGFKSALTRTTGSEIVRQTSAQARFTQLLRQADDELLIRSRPRRKAPRWASIDRLGELADDERYDDWAVDASRLTRGALIEVDVALGAEAIYRVSETITSITGIVKDAPAAFGLAGHQGLQEAELLANLLDRLLAELIPVRGEVADLRLVELEDRRLVVRHDLLRRLGEDPRVKATTFDVVAFTDRSLYWKDVRRVLFGGAQYTVLARVAEDGILATWSPVVLTDVVRDISADLADSLDAAGSGLLDAIRETTADPTIDRTVGEARLLYLSLLKPEPPEQLLGSAPTLFSDADALSSDYEIRRQQLSPVTELLSSHGIEIDAQDAARVRSELSEALDAKLPLATSTAPSSTPPCLHGEIVATYW